MASKSFKKEMTQRFIELVKFLTMSEKVQSKTEIGILMDQPLQVVSKLLSGERIITLEQIQKLILNTNIDAHWFITGKGLMLRDDTSSIKESKMAYYLSNNESSRSIAAILPLVTDLEERIEELRKENEGIQNQLKELNHELFLLNKEKKANPPSKSSP
jgi:hypothetical protein